MKTVINSQKALYDHIEYLRTEFEKHKYLRTDTKTGKQRTNLQNAALHVYCDQIADALTNRGITFTMFFKDGFEVPWTRDIVKDNVWRPIQEAICDEVSTTKPITSDYKKIYEALDKKLCEWDFDIPWPSKDNIQSKMT